jgi:hypothetical protein
LEGQPVEFLVPADDWGLQEFNVTWGGI